MAKERAKRRQARISPEMWSQLIGLAGAVIGLLAVIIGISATAGETDGPPPVASTPSALAPTGEPPASPTPGPATEPPPSPSTEPAPEPDPTDEPEPSGDPEPSGEPEPPSPPGPSPAPEVPRPRPEPGHAVRNATQGMQNFAVPGCLDLDSTGAFWDHPNGDDLCVQEADLRTYLLAEEIVVFDAAPGLDGCLANAPNGSDPAEEHVPVEPGTWLCVWSNQGRPAEITVAGNAGWAVALEITAWDR